MRFVIILCVLTLSILDSRAAVAQETRPLRISARPAPELPADHGTLDAIGTVMLKIEFLPNGKIGEVIPLRKMPVSDLTELAVDAAKRIEFDPEVRNGEPVGVSKIILYSYSWEFGGWKGSPNFIALVDDNKDEQAEAIIQKAVQALGGDKYLNVKTQVGRGKFSIIKDG